MLVIVNTLLKKLNAKSFYEGGLLFAEACINSLKRNEWPSMWPDVRLKRCLKVSTKVFTSKTGVKWGFLFKLLRVKCDVGVFLYGRNCLHEPQGKCINVTNIILLCFLKMGQPRPLFRLFVVFSKKHQYNFYNKYMWKNVHLVYGAGIWTHNLQNMSLLP